MNPIKSTCMFCNSTAYGNGCAYSPHKKHVHISNGKNCIYCGSSSIGMGCSQNPFSRMHIRGVEYNTMSKESVHQSVMTGLFLSRLTQPITEMQAYKLGLINEDGQRIKDSVTDEEKAALTPLDTHILKIRRLIGENLIELFKSSILLEMVSNCKEAEFCAEQYVKETELKSLIEHATDYLENIFIQGTEQGFSRSHIENLIIESILTKYEDSKDQ